MVRGHMNPGLNGVLGCVFVAGEEEQVEDAASSVGDGDAMTVPEPVGNAHRRRHRVGEGPDDQRPAGADPLPSC
jgi:hypothetical protein